MGILVGVNTETPNKVIGVLDCVVRAHYLVFTCTLLIECLISALGVYLLLVYTVVSMYRASILRRASSLFPLGRLVTGCTYDFVYGI